MEKLKRYSRPRKAENLDCGETDIFEKKMEGLLYLGKENLESCEGDKLSRWVKVSNAYIREFYNKPHC